MISWPISTVKKNIPNIKQFDRKHIIPKSRSKFKNIPLLFAARLFKPAIIKIKDIIEIITTTISVPYLDIISSIKEDMVLCISPFNTGFPFSAFTIMLSYEYNPVYIANMTPAICSKNVLMLVFNVSLPEKEHCLCSAQVIIYLFYLFLL